MISNMPASSWKNPIHIMAFGFGSGASPYAPGTTGTLAAIPLYFLLAQLSLFLYIVAVVAVVAIGVYLCDRTSKDLGVHDHSGIVWDEFAGFFITMIAIPVTWWTVVLGFFLFRLFDVWKPWPIKAIDEKVHGGLGIMLDDVIAGFFSWLILFSICFILIE